MPKSELVRLWEGKKDLPNLKYIDLSYSCKLISTPDFSGLPKLETLDLVHCFNLVEIHPSLAVLKKLKSLRLYYCKSIKSLPSEFEMDSLEILDLRSCSNLKKIPEFGEQMKNLQSIDLCGTAIEEIPSSIGHLVGLKELDLASCKNLKKIPEFGKQMKNLQSIDLSWTAIEDIPSSIGHLVGLKELHLGDCKNLKKIPEFGKQMKNLQSIGLSGTAIEDIPSSIGHLVGLKELFLGNCKNLLNLPMAIYSLESLQRLVLDKSDEGSDAKARDGCGLLRCLGLEKSRPNPPRWGLVLPSLIRLCYLRELSLNDLELYEGDIPDDIGCLSFLEKLYLGGNKFVSLPESIRCLSKLSSLVLERCKNLQELPPLPSERHLEVNVRNCTSLKRLLDPSKMMSRYTGTNGKEYCCYGFLCLNNIALAQDEGWINTILSTILVLAAGGGSVIKVWDIQ